MTEGRRGSQWEKRCDFPLVQAVFCKISHRLKHTCSRHVLHGPDVETHTISIIFFKCWQILMSSHGFGSQCCFHCVFSWTFNARISNSLAQRWIGKQLLEKSEQRFIVCVEGSGGCGREWLWALQWQTPTLGEQRGWYRTCADIAQS